MLRMVSLVADAGAEAVVAAVEEERAEEAVEVA